MGNTSLSNLDYDMKDVKKSAKCEKQCLPNCEETTYEFSMSISKLDLPRLCEDNTWTQYVRLCLE